MNEEAQKLLAQAEERVHSYQMGWISLQYAAGDLLQVVVAWMKLVEERISKVEESCPTAN